MRFALLTDDTVIEWDDDGSVSGFPDEAVDEARRALLEPQQAATPTGPYFERGTPEASWIALRRLWPTAEVFGDPPVLEQQPDELPAAD
jgi:hypothetical protein